MPDSKNSTFDKPIIVPQKSVSEPLEEHKKRDERGKEFIRKRIIAHLNEIGITNPVFLKPKDN